MTGLDPSVDSIIQLACFVTDHELNILDPSGWTAVVRHSKETLDKMSDWCVRTHSSTGLIEAALQSTTTPEQAAASLLEYIKIYVPSPRIALLAGNSIHADRTFLSREPFVKVLEHLHYRIFDVSTLKEAARRWASDSILQDAPKKTEVHEAQRDILESIEEARYYKEKFFATT
ncbi:MAG: hypothetical protein M1815_000713 [Lichina confinis]|nr:MAG: hypothetical protein M1815_000713 [Lichina confinis]